MAFKGASLARLERLGEQGHLDVFYGDECGVSLLPCVPYGWQFTDETVSSPSHRGKGINCFALITCDNRCFFRLSERAIDADLVCDYLDQFSRQLVRETVVVLDNAPVHQAELKKRRAGWEARGLSVFFLPVYSPHLNRAEILWKKLKYEWLVAEDYAERSLLCYRVWQCLASVGRELTIGFKPFQSNN